MTDHRDQHEPGSADPGWNKPWVGGGPGWGPSWVGRGRPWEPPTHRMPPGFAPGRRFRRGAFVALLFVVLLVASLASVAASIIAGNAPAPWITVSVSILVILGLVLSARWLWRSTRTIGSLMDAADRVAAGDYETRLPAAPTRSLGRLTGAFNQMTERLDSNERRRRELLADVAHELRTPLQVIRGTVEGMLDGLYPVEPERLRPLIDETQVMARLLDDLRTLSMAEAGVLALHRETVSPRATVEDAALTFRGMAEEAGVAIKVGVDDGVPQTIEADPVRLAEVLSNLLANAIRHTPRGGGIELTTSRAQNGVRFEVADTGPGIPPDQLPFVFDRFVSSADAGGTGLGLGIAKRLVEAHGGTIEAVAGPSGGTRIRFLIPTA